MSGQPGPRPWTPDPEPEPPAYAVAWSGGKDSTLALHRARTAGLHVTHLFSVFEGASGRVPYHGVRAELLAAQGEALGLESVRMGAGEDGFESAFVGGLDRLREEGVEGVVFGNIHLDDVRGWYEERVTGRGLDHREPLWGGDPARLAREVVRLGYRATVVSVMLGSGDPGWLGRALDLELLEEIADREDVDPCGEKGEFHSFVRDGPLFHRPVSVREGEEMEVEGHRLLDLVPDGEAGR